MQVRVLFFGSLRDMMGKASDSVTLPEGADLKELLQMFARNKPALGELLPSVAISVNEEYASRDTKLKDRDEVALLPPVSGGTTPLKPTEGLNGAPGSGGKDQTTPPFPKEGKDGALLKGQYCEIVREKIATQAIADSMKRGEDGAVVVFEGIVRNNTRGRRTLYLDYHAYEEMAIKQMDALVTEACRKFPIDKARIVHRLGKMDVGETSVLIVVTSAHRGAAFEACRFVIDTLKKTVPIWKKEFFEDGAVWADGEPFPEKLVI